MSDKKKTEEKPAEIAIIDERTIRDKIYEVRCVKVMLDFELAEIYGYETKNFNRQVKNNAERLYNPNALGAGAHHFTADAAERDHLIEIGWRDEKTGWYGALRMAAVHFK